MTDVMSPPRRVNRGQATEEVPARPPRPPAWTDRARKPRKPRGFLGTSIGLKVVMALTGAIMIAYLVLHMIGNLKIFSGRDAFNEYAEWLRTLLYPALPYGGVLWIIRVVLIVAVVAHIAAAILLTLRSRRARPVRYAAGRRPVAQSYASRTMRWGGVIVGLYVIYHLLDMTFGAASLAGPDSTPADRYVVGFQHWYIVAAYTLALLVLGLHLRHGVWSALRTLGAGVSNAVSVMFAAGLIGGFLIGPAAVLIGVIQ